MKFDNKFCLCGGAGWLFAGILWRQTQRGMPDLVFGNISLIPMFLLLALSAGIGGNAVVQLSSNRPSNRYLLDTVNVFLIGAGVAWSVFGFANRADTVFFSLLGGLLLRSFGGVEGDLCGALMCVAGGLLLIGALFPEQYHPSPSSTATVRATYWGCLLTGVGSVGWAALATMLHVSAREFAANDGGGMTLDAAIEKLAERMEHVGLCNMSAGACLAVHGCLLLALPWLGKTERSRVTA